MEAIPIVMGLAGAFMENKAAGKQRKAMENVARQQEAAGEQAKYIANQNAANTEAETAESVRRESIAADQAQANLRARAAASGGTGGGSTGNFIDTQQRTSDQYIDWLKKSGSSRAQIEREQGKYSSMTASSSAAGTRASTAGSKWAGLAGLTKAAGSIGDLYNPASTGTDMNSIWT